jgi:hypothetical protein
MMNGITVVLGTAIKYQIAEVVDPRRREDDKKVLAELQQ